MNGSVVSLNEAFSIENRVLKKWLEGVKSRNAATLVSLLNSDTLLSPPFQDHTVVGASEILKTLRSFDQSVNNFKYQRVYLREGSFILEFSGDIEGEPLQGIDLFNINEVGKIESIQVMARPLGAVKKLGVAVELFLGRKNDSTLG